MTPNALSVAEIAVMLAVSEQRVRTLLRSGLIHGKQMGKQWIVDPDAVRTYQQGGAIDNPPDRVRAPTPLPTIKALSFFSGAMGLDLGLEKAGIHPLMACEVDKASRRTITANRPDIGLIGDIWKYDAQAIRKMAGLGETDTVDVMVGGPPCQAFSTAGARRGFQDDRGNAFLRYLDLILELQPRYAVIENVRGLLSAPMEHRPHADRDETWDPSVQERPGGALLHILGRLQGGGYRVSFNLYNAANFGVPQVRERVVMVCTRDGATVPHLMPTHSKDSAFDLPQWQTLSDVFRDVKGCDHVDFPENRLKYYRMLSSGQYWKHLPTDLQREALGNAYFSGGGKTGFLRRLDWNKPSCTLVTAPNMPATDIAHPSEDRPLSIQEYKRIQQFPDDWRVCGSLTDQYKQIGNAVPVGLGEAIGRAILNHMGGRAQQPPTGFSFSRYKNTDEISWEAQTRLEGFTEKSVKSSAPPPTAAQPVRRRDTPARYDEVALAA
jgi:DNA (cytosine-5)-methyltransferase 1